jgi:PST family polysaccharide transporter
MAIDTLIKKFFSTTFVKLTFWSALSTFFRMLAGLITIKLSAHYIGAEGIAIVSQYSNLIMLTGIAGSACVNQGITTFVAKNYKDEKIQNEYISTGLIITLIVSLFLSATLLLFNTTWNSLFFENTISPYFLILLGLTLMFISGNYTLVGVVNGYKEYKIIVSSNVAASIFAIVSSVILLPFFGLQGALLNALFNQAVLFFITFYLLNKRVKLFNVVDYKNWNKVFSVQLIKFSTMTIVTALSQQVTYLIIRNLIITHISLEYAGLWDSANRLTYMILMVLTTTYTMYYLPRIAELNSDSEIKSEVYKTLQVVAPSVFAVFLLVYLLRDPIILILFDEKFSPIGDFLLILLLAEFIKVLSWFLTAIFYARQQTKAFILSELLYYAIWIGTAVIFIPRLSIDGAFYAYLVAAIVYLTMVVVFFRKIFLISHEG